MEDRLGQLVDELALDDNSDIDRSQQMLDEMADRRRREGSEIDQVKAENVELKRRVERLEKGLNALLNHPDWWLAGVDPNKLDQIINDTKWAMEEG